MDIDRAQSISDAGYGMAPRQEYVAGYIDGVRAGGIEFRKAVRSGLERFGLAMDANGDLVGIPATSVPETEAAPEADNPLDDADYAEGWDDGRTEAWHSELDKVRAQGLARDLFVGDDASVTTLEVASRLVSWFQRARSATGAGEFSAPALAEFLATLRTIAAREPEPPATPTRLEIIPAGSAPDAAPVEQPTAGGPRRNWRVWTVVKKHLDRRLAIAALTTGILSGTTTWFVARNPGVPDLTRLEQSSSTAAAGPWALMTPEARQQMETLNSAVIAAEANPGIQPLLPGALAGVMGLPNVDEPKQMLLRFVGDTDRSQYLTSLLPALNPAVSNAYTRSAVLTTIGYALNHLGPTAIDPSIRPQLEAYRTSGLEPDANVNAVLGRLLPRLP